MAEANSINAATTGIVGNTGTSFTGTAVTQYNVITGASTSSTLNNVAPTATSGVPLISQGSSSQPIFGTAVVAGGGTGVATLTGLALGSGTSAFTGVTYVAETAFTANLTFGGASTGITYFGRQAVYQQIGNFILVQIQFTLTSKGSATGVAAVTGLPTVAAGGLANYYPCILTAVTLDASNLHTAAFLNGGTSTLGLYEFNISGTATQLTNTNFANGSSVFINLAYAV